MMKTRNQILHLLFERGQCTIKELADELDINPVSVRHHLLKLEAEGLVQYEEERHGVGRPRRVYSLTKKGLEQFPAQYVRLASKLLSYLKSALPSEMVTQAFVRMAQEMAAEIEGIEFMTTEERLNLLANLLRREGFVVSWEKKGDTYVIRETVCPYLELGSQHPEICVLDETLIGEMLNVDAERVQCMLTGDKECVYLVQKSYELEKV